VSSASRVALYDRLTDAERANVRAFRDQVHLMWRAVPINAEGRPVLLRVENDYDWSTVTETVAPTFRGRRVFAPSDNEVAALMVRVRAFLLDAQPGELNCHYAYVRNLIARRLHDAGVTTHEAFFRDAKKASDLQMVRVTGVPVDGKYLLDLWLHEAYFHRDIEKRETFARLRRTHGDDRVRAALMIALGLFQTQVIDLHQFIEAETDIYERLGAL